MEVRNGAGEGGGVAMCLRLVVRASGEERGGTSLLDLIGKEFEFKTFWP